MVIGLHLLIHVPVAIFDLVACMHAHICFDIICTDVRPNNNVLPCVYTQTVQESQKVKELQMQLNMALAEVSSLKASSASTPSPSPCPSKMSPGTDLSSPASATPVGGNDADGQDTNASLCCFLLV